VRLVILPISSGKLFNWLFERLSIVRLVSFQTSSGTLVNRKQERSRVVEADLITSSILFLASVRFGCSIMKEICMERKMVL